MTKKIAQIKSFALVAYEEEKLWGVLATGSVRQMHENKKNSILEAKRWGVTTDLRVLKIKQLLFKLR